MNRVGEGTLHDAVDKPMTPDEAQAIVGMWSLEQRLRSGHELNPTVKDLSEGLSIPPEEVQAYLDRVRSSAVLNPRQTKRRDIRLATAAFLAMAVIALAFVSFLNYRNAQHLSSRVPSPVMPDWIQPPPTAGMPVILDTPAPPMEMAPLAPAAEGRFVFSSESRRYMPTLPSDVSGAHLRQELSTFVGGPLASQSAVWNRPLDQATIDRLLSNGTRFGPYTVTQSSSGRQRVLEWKTFRLSFGGKEVRAEFPFALSTQKELRTAVEAAHARILDEMVASALQLSSE